MYLKDLTNGEGYKDFDPIYDHLFKVSTDKDGVFSVKVAKNSDGVYVVNEYGDLESTDDTIKTVNGKPYLEIKDCLLYTSPDPSRGCSRARPFRRGCRRSHQKSSAA